MVSTRTSRLSALMTGVGTSAIWPEAASAGWPEACCAFTTGNFQLTHPNAIANRTARNSTREVFILHPFVYVLIPAASKWCSVSRARNLLGDLNRIVHQIGKQ